MTLGVVIRPLLVDFRPLRVKYRPLQVDLIPKNSFSDLCQQMLLALEVKSFIFGIESGLI